MMEKNENVESNTLASNQNKFLYWILASTVSLITVIVVIANGMIDARIRNLETFGSPALRERVVKIETDQHYIHNQLQQINRNQEKIMEMLSEMLKQQQSTRRKISLRHPVASDVPRILAIHDRFYRGDFPMNLGNAFGRVVAVQDERILGFGWLEHIVEATVILDLSARPRDKFDAMRQIISYGEGITKANGFDQMHVFPKDDRFTSILKKHLNFSDITGDCLVKNLESVRGQE